jgi:hypothetical protein
MALPIISAREVSGSGRNTQKADNSSVLARHACEGAGAPASREVTRIRRGCQAHNDAREGTTRATQNLDTCGKTEYSPGFSRAWPVEKAVEQNRLSHAKLRREKPRAFARLEQVRPFAGLGPRETYKATRAVLFACVGESPREFSHLVIVVTIRCHLSDATITDFRTRIDCRNSNCPNPSCQATLVCFDPSRILPRLGKRWECRNRKLD